MERIVFALIIVFFTLRDPGAILATSLNLSGLNWYLHDGTANLSEADVRDAGWIRARVPGSIQSDLEAAHLLKPLWYGIGGSPPPMTLHVGTGGTAWISCYLRNRRANACALSLTASISNARYGSMGSASGIMPGKLPVSDSTCLSSQGKEN